MESGINTLKDLVELIAWIVGAGSIAFAAYTYRLTENQFNFAVIVSCTERFQRIMGRLKSKDEEERRQAIKQYIDLCDEELFYFKNKYLPDEIIEEWIDGMVFYLPHFVGGENKNKDSAYLKEIEEMALLKEYPRIKKAFSVNNPFNVADENERRKLVHLVKKNLK